MAEKDPKVAKLRTMLSKLAWRTRDEQEAPLLGPVPGFAASVVRTSSAARTS